MSKRLGPILLAATLLCAGLLWALLGRESIEEGRCRLVRKKADPESQLIGLTYQFIRPLETKPDGVQDRPADFDQPRYYTITSGGKPILMAADYSQKHVRLCIDTDGDGIFSEERCLTATPSEETPVSDRKQRFGPISLASGAAGKGDGAFYMNCYREDARGLLIPFAAFFRTGKLLLRGQVYRVAVADGDYDGSYRSILPLPLDRPWRLPGCDVFAIDLNHNGTFEISLRDRSEVMPLGRFVEVAGEYYAIDIAADGTSIAVSRTDPQFGTLTVEPNDIAVELRLWSDATDQHLMHSQERQLPAGRYKAIHAILTKVDASGIPWSLSSNSSSAFTRLGPLECFTIESGQTTSIRIGPPFVVKADVERAVSGTVSISPVLVGCAGEEYMAGLQQGGRRPSPPAFKIVDEEGTLLVEDNFKYG